MKYLNEYRDPGLVKRYLAELFRVTKGVWKIMEICGGQTHSLVKNGILNMLPKGITMIHGPGCPVCVTPVSIIDQAIAIALRPEVILCSFGDMVRVPGSVQSLLQAKASGADIRIVYSPLEAVKLARANPGKEVVFFAVGFETTAPANALSVLHAAQHKLRNYSILTSHVLVPPAMESILADPDNQIDGFLAAGHVCTVMGLDQYEPIASRYKVPVVATGFEPVDLLQGILMAVHQLETGQGKVENQYNRVIRQEGNISAIRILKEVFQPTDREWRGLGFIPMSGFELREVYSRFDAFRKFRPETNGSGECRECIAGQVLKGLKKPVECPVFATGCTPEHPLGAPMVSSEGACAAYFHYAIVPAKQMVQ